METVESGDAGDSALLKDLADLLDERDERDGAVMPAQQQQSPDAMLRSLVPSELLGSLMLEALNGFLFLLNSDGMVDFVSESTSGFIGGFQLVYCNGRRDTVMHLMLLGNGMITTFEKGLSL